MTQRSRIICLSYPKGTYRQRYGLNYSSMKDALGELYFTLFGLLAQGPKFSLLEIVTLLAPSAALLAQASLSHLYFQGGYL